MPTTSCALLVSVRLAAVEGQTTVVGDVCAGFAIGGVRGRNTQ